MPSGIAIAAAIMADAPSIADIYAHHVRHGTATFETVPPDTAAMRERLRAVTAAGSPWLIVRDRRDDMALGFGYAAQLRDRAAYRFACEDSIYVRHDVRGRGIGTALLAELLVASEAAGFRQMLAVIGGAQPASVALHARAGFVACGRLRSVGRKHGRWLDTLYMQRALGAGDTDAPAFEPN